MPRRPRSPPMEEGWRVVDGGDGFEVFFFLGGG